MRARSTSAVSTALVTTSSPYYPYYGDVSGLDADHDSSACGSYFGELRLAETIRRLREVDWDVVTRASTTIRGSHPSSHRACEAATR